jgi:hypothetical protein
MLYGMPTLVGSNCRSSRIPLMVNPFTEVNRFIPGIVMVCKHPGGRNYLYIPDPVIRQHFFCYFGATQAVSQVDFGIMPELAFQLAAYGPANQCNGTYKYIIEHHSFLIFE